MKTSKYLLVTGILAVITITVPDIVTYGLLLFIVPGLILLISPTLFVYSILFYLMKAFINSVVIRVIILLVVGSAIPFYFNLPVWNLEKRFTAHDIIAKRPITLNDTIAIFKPYNNVNPYYDDVLCDEFCRKLLYNGIVSTILVGYDYPGPDSDNKEYEDPIKLTNMTAFTIIKKENCVYSPIDSNLKLDFVTKRIAAGDCLVSFKKDNADAKFILVDRYLNKGLNPYLYPWDISISTLTVRRFEVIEQKDRKYIVLDRRTQVESNPLFIPLAVGIAGSNGLHINVGYLRYNFKENMYTDISNNLDFYYKVLFGDSFNNIKNF